MTAHTTVTREQWDTTRAELLEREKALTRLEDELAAQRRELPWLAVEKEYTLQTLNARDVTMMCVSRAPVDQLVAYRKRMGWSFPWASSHESDFSLDFGGSTSIRDAQAWLATSADQLPPIAAHNAAASGVDVATYISEGFAFVSFALDGDTVYQTYSAGRRGVEVLMPYYAILDRVPSGRNEGAEFQTWLRRRDEYGND